jgi:diaminopimelate epimerase
MAPSTTTWRRALRKVKYWAEMTGDLSFDKYEGIGNDFVLVEQTAPLAERRVSALCDRHFGIGGDGVLVVASGRSKGARASMIVQNADGSRPEMCGNGLRCVALHLARADGVDRAEYIVDTDSGPRVCLVERQGSRCFVRIDLGRAAAAGEHRVEFEGTQFTFARISTGNPHAISLDGLIPIDAIDRLAPRVSGQIRGGTNVEFVRELGPRAFEVVVWERGVGRTLACGTGAGATAAALALAGRAPYGEPIEIRLPGGPLEVTVAQETLELQLRGAAMHVFTGRV